MKYFFGETSEIAFDSIVIQVFTERIDKLDLKVTLRLQLGVYLSIKTRSKVYRPWSSSFQLTKMQSIKLELL